MKLFGCLKKRKDEAAEAAAAYQRGDYTRARILATKGLRKTPDNAALLLLVGNVFYLEQNWAEAEKWYQKILELQPRHQEALINLGEVFLHQQKYEQAAAVSQCLNRQVAGRLLAAKCAFEQEQYAEAEVGFESVLHDEKTDFWTWNLLSQAAQKNGHYERALEAAWQAVELSNGADSQHLNLAYALYETALETGVEKVVPLLKKWHQKYAGNGIVRQSWNAFFPSRNFVRADSFYLKEVFDNFADSFDDVLASLAYSVPQLIASEIKEKYVRILPGRPKILDAGCGTGLCGVELDSVFKKYDLYGVDLSEQMLQKAVEKKLYRAVKCADIEVYLQGQKNQFDLIVAADVITYFGALDSLFEKCFFSLKNNGVFIFSATAGDDEISGWKQHLSGRFLHTEKYLKNVLQKNGFQNVFLTSCILRKEGEKDVHGWVISAIKKSRK